VLNIPEAGFDHTMDALRYAITSLIDFVPDHIRQQQQTHFEATKWKQQFNSAK
jgi:hypothetical protein